MNTKQIRCILELAQTQNFNRAAENLFISQPTLTYQLKAAEEEIGFAIFSRSARGASLTPAGAQFVTTLQTIQQALQAAIEQGQIPGQHPHRAAHPVGALFPAAGHPHLCRDASGNPHPAGL